MDFSTILVDLESDRGYAARVDVAADIARRFAGHVVGLTTLGVSLEPFRGAGDEAGKYAELARRKMEARRAAAQQAFDTAMAAAGQAIGYTHLVMEEESGWALAHEARAADIVVLGQPDGDQGMPALMAESAEYVLLEAGRPILLVPHDVHRLALGSVAMAWDGSREAARAMADAMPLLRQAEQVTIMTVHKRGAAYDEIAEDALPAVQRYLERHGVIAGVRLEETAGEIAPALLDAAHAVHADLLVCGGYGHSRVRQLVMGGTTRTLMRSAPILLLMSH
ncbi:universal stress protein [Cupriavidus respiraculi]|uniref:UspA domain-containing protein n=1 Tax=Cupriavidus respiraculi TaxID=195930 RepID=A0ABM8WGU2_9BURK|nr:universal stress protein [Cupriavidus respiraculi]CAG9166568.1 hypothetical protein LMG21510_00434 [Cupriavidus respiraculi]